MKDPNPPPAPSIGETTSRTSAEIFPLSAILSKTTTIARSVTRKRLRRPLFAGALPLRYPFAILLCRDEVFVVADQRLAVHVHVAQNRRGAANDGGKRVRGDNHRHAEMAAQKFR